MTAAEFEACMAPFAPFPEAPAVAVALSGGADSLALLILLRDWTTRRGGRVLALIVDHGLRLDSAAEAQRVARQIRVLGVEGHVLPWVGTKPEIGLQARAREARYCLLQAACRRLGLLYLALGHHREDQAETFLMRLESGSGLGGLSGMSAMTVLEDVLLLRPLLAIPKPRLQALLQARGLSWIEDPTNRDRRHRRVAIRCLRPHLAMRPQEIGQATSSLGRLRCSMEREVLAWLGRTCRWRPEGYAILDRSALREPHPIASQAVTSVLKTIGGAAYGPAPKRVGRLLADLEAGRGSTTLSGCRLLLEEDSLVVVRESHAPAALMLQAGRVQQWDRRFRLRSGVGLPANLRLESLTEEGWRRMDRRPDGKDLPAALLWSLPCVYDSIGPLALPALAWHRQEGEVLDLSLRFHPLYRPGSALFAVA